MFWEWNVGLSPGVDDARGNRKASSLYNFLLASYDVRGVCLAYPGHAVSENTSHSFGLNMGYFTNTYFSSTFLSQQIVYLLITPAPALLPRAANALIFSLG